jgi:hypothetical protein
MVRLPVNEKFILFRIVHADSGANQAFFFALFTGVWAEGVGGKPNGGVKINTHLPPPSQTELLEDLPLLPFLRTERGKFCAPPHPKEMIYYFNHRTASLTVRSSLVQFQAVIST